MENAVRNGFFRPAPGQDEKPPGAARPAAAKRVSGGVPPGTARPGDVPLLPGKIPGQPKGTLPEMPGDAYSSSAVRSS